MSEVRSIRRALVTGCAGFIGSHLTESLLADGIEVIGVDCFNANYGRAQKLWNLSHAQEWDSFEFIPIDLSRGDLDGIVSEVDTVFHLAAEPGVRPSWGARFDRYLANNLTATHQLLDSLTRANPAARMVYASSSSIYGQAEMMPTPETTAPAPVSPYGMTKLSGEHLCGMYCENHDLVTTSLRYFTVFGPRQRPDMAFHIFCRAALEGKPIQVFGDGRQTRDFTFVSDVVAATRGAAIAPVEPGSAYNVGGGIRASLREVIDHIGELNGAALDVDYRPKQAGDVKDTGADTTRARADLGFAPQTPLKDGIAAEFEWVKGLLAETA